jgi:hypothetical protein
MPDPSMSCKTGVARIAFWKNLTSEAIDFDIIRAEGRDTHDGKGLRILPNHKGGKVRTNPWWPSKTSTPMPLFIYSLYPENISGASMT